MLLKKHYAKPADWVAVKNVRRKDGTLLVPGMKENACLNPPPISHIQLGHTGTNPEQNFPEYMVDEYMKTGLMTFGSDGELILKTDKGDLRYTVLRTPGSYCLHCGKRIDDDTVNDGAPSREHVAVEHKGVKPIEGAPSGYERIHKYECILNSVQHEKYNFGMWDAKRRGKV